MNSLSIKNLNRQVPNIINMMSQSDGLFRLLLMQTNEPSSLQDAGLKYFEIIIDNQRWHLKSPNAVTVLKSVLGFRIRSFIFHN